jgi:hypothetical protein
MTYQEIVKIYHWGKVLYAPLSHITISSVCEQLSIQTCLKRETTLVYDAVFVCPKRNPYLYTDNDTLDRESVILYLYFLSSQLTQKISQIIYYIHQVYVYIIIKFYEKCSQIFDESIPTLFIVSEPDCASALMHRCELMNNTGNRFRSYVLGVMSPARFPCAMPVLNDWVAVFCVA